MNLQHKATGDLQKIFEKKRFLFNFLLKRGSEKKNQDFLEKQRKHLAKFVKKYGKATDQQTMEERTQMERDKKDGEERDEEGRK